MRRRFHKLGCFDQFPGQALQGRQNGIVAIVKNDFDLDVDIARARGNEGLLPGDGDDVATMQIGVHNRFRNLVEGHNLDIDVAPVGRLPKRCKVTALGGAELCPRFSFGSVAAFRFQGHFQVLHQHPGRAPEAVVEWLVLRGSRCG